MFEASLPMEILSQKDVQSIVRAINYSKEQYEMWKNERNLGFENGKYLDRWNFIFANIRDTFIYKPFKTYPVSRGALWKFIVLYNTDTNILYLILKENTFKQIRTHRDNPYHYVRVLNSKNFNLQSEIKQQLNLFSEFETISNEYIDEDLERMISEIKNEVKGCVNILFKENNDGVYKISGNLANYDLDIFKTYDLSKYITADIDDIIDTKNDIVGSSPKIELNIRKSKIKSKKDEIVEDKIKRDGEQMNKN